MISHSRFWLLLHRRVLLKPKKVETFHGSACFLRALSGLRNQGICIPSLPEARVDDNDPIIHGLFLH